MVKVLCEIQECIYNDEFPNKGQAYRYQCTNDEIEIGHFENYARCYCFEKNDEEESEED